MFVPYQRRRELCQKGTSTAVLFCQSLNAASGLGMIFLEFIKRETESQMVYDASNVQHVQYMCVVYRSAPEPAFIHEI